MPRRLRPPGNSCASGGRDAERIYRSGRTGTTAALHAAPTIISSAIFFGANGVSRSALAANAGCVNEALCEKTAAGQCRNPMSLCDHTKFRR